MPVSHYLCWNGPCEGQLVTDCPAEIDVGYACAVPFKTKTGHDRYAVYILLQNDAGARGLVFEKQYTTPAGAQRRVQYVTHAVRLHNTGIALN